MRTPPGPVQMTKRVWELMVRRCHSVADKSYPRYGGRGIAVCAPWRESFGSFYADMGPRPPGLFLDRIDNDGDYEPGNCRWVTMREQQRNKRNNRIVTHEGKSMCVAAWAEHIGIRHGTLLWRLDHGWPVHKALSLNASTQCLGEAALKLQELGEYGLAADLLKQVASNQELIREIQP